MATISSTKFQELLAKARAKNKANAAKIDNLNDQLTSNAVEEVELPAYMGKDPTGEQVEELLSLDAVKDKEVSPDKQGVAREVVLNEKQRMFCDTVLSGASTVLIGAAGTGKTTSCRQTTKEMIESGNYGKLEVATKAIKVGAPGIIVLSYTRKAVANIRRAVHPDIKPNTVTIHKLLEFEPVFFQVFDPASGKPKNTMRFEPNKTAQSPLPASIKAVFIEESSMVPVDLHKLLIDALPHKPQVIYLGDIQQLPPVFGLAILGFKMVELPVTELTEVYRQALASPIISLAWKLLEGNPHAFSSRSEIFEGPDGKKRIRCPALDELSFKANVALEGEPEKFSAVKFQVWQKSLSVDHQLQILNMQLQHWIGTGYYNPQEDIILCPFKKAQTLSTTEINNYVNQYLGEKRNATVYHVIAGFNNHFLAVGDRVMFDKEDCFITSIKPNPAYLGKRPISSSTALNRDGSLRRKLTAAEEYLAKQEAEAADEYTIEELESVMEAAVGGGEEERVTASSHIIHLVYAYNVTDTSDMEKLEDYENNEGDKDIIISAASEINNLMGGYAITVHAAQGSEYGKVILVMGKVHATMNSRELLYTAVTRARDNLHIICEPDTFERGIKSQAIKGNSIADKAAFFQGKVIADKRNGTGGY